MAENSDNRRIGFEIFFGGSMFLCLIIGLQFGPDIYKLIGQWPIYTVVAHWWSMLSLLGAGVFDVLMPVVKKAAGKIGSDRSRTARRAWIVGLAVLYVVAAWVNVAVGVAVSRPAERSKGFEKAGLMNFDEIEPDIYVTVVLEDGGVPRDRDVQYEIVGIEPVELPRKIILLDLPRYIVCQKRGAGPIKVTVRPLYPDVTVRFADPLVALGEETFVKKYDPALLGNAPAGKEGDYSPAFQYRFGGTGAPLDYTICGTENKLGMRDKTVLLRWNNNWELSYRDVLNEQEEFAEAGETVDFYYPGERIAFDLDMLRGSESRDRALLEKLRGAARYELFWESADDRTVQADEAVIKQALSASDMPELPKCMVKTGPDIAYHCYAGEDDLGYYCIVTGNGTVKWEAAPGQTALVLRLDIG